jgi:hypothetical protein
MEFHIKITLQGDNGTEHTSYAVSRDLERTVKRVLDKQGAPESAIKSIDVEVFKNKRASWNKR